MGRLSNLKSRVDGWSALCDDVASLQGMIALVAESPDPDMQSEVDEWLARVSKSVNALEFETLLSGEYAENGAILAVHAGAGGTESQDWAQMLLRMFIRWAENHNYRAEILDQSEGEEAGIKSATIQIDGSFVYGRLQSERGVHRLVRQSPYDAAHRRHTSFALVEVLPQLDEQEDDVAISPDDLRIDTYRSSGAGGQHVNKTDSAVRLTHIPTGIVVTCQNERSQLQNREVAMRILMARLAERRLEEREAEQSRLKGAHVAAGWGNQIRSYVLHPYKMVKDERTKYETSNTTAVLDGDLDAFIESFLRYQADLHAGAEEAGAVTA
ncbi:MAG: peptide chain release factor 2 [Chloroflexota bacterium]